VLRIADVPHSHGSCRFGAIPCEVGRDSCSKVDGRCGRARSFGVCLALNWDAGTIELHADELGSQLKYAHGMLTEDIVQHHS
jgi:hypothetical protein